MIYGVDISNWQRNVNYAALKNNGIEFAIVKASEGTGYQDPLFSTHYNGAKNAGMIVAAYHYVRGYDVDGQFNNIKSVVPAGTPVIPDIEEGAGDMDSIKRLINKLRSNGYPVPLIYLPQWYWNKMGQPSLDGLPPNWWSWYPDNAGQERSLDQGLNMVPSKIWSGFGGLDVLIIQFSSSHRIPGYSGNLDVNAYKGSTESLAQLFGGSAGNKERREENFLGALEEWEQRRAFERILRMSSGVEGENFNGEQYNDETAQRAALGLKLDAIGDAIKQLSDDPKTSVKLDDEQLKVLQKSVADRAAEELQASTKKLEEALKAQTEYLADKFNLDKEEVKSALNEWFGVKVTQ